MKGYLNDAVRASVSATKAEKKAASKMAFEQRGTPFVYNAYLILVAVGAPLTEAKVTAEAKKLATANERHFAREESACQ